MTIFGLRTSMKKLKELSFCILVLCIVCSSVVYCQDEEGVVAAAAPMKKSEQEALYAAIQGFVGKWWNGSDLYPDPCGWTPIQGVSCDLFDGFMYVTDLSIGPVHDNSLNCASDVKFTHNLFALRRLKSVTFFNCFVSPGQHPVSIPTENWHTFSDSLESLEFRSNPGLIGQMPSTFGDLKNLKSLVLMENGLSGDLSPSVGNLTKLRRLNLAGNSFSGHIPESFGGLNQLLILDMSRNSLSGTLPPTFGGLGSLLKLDLSNNQLYGNIPEELGNLHDLTLLDLSNNRFSNGLCKSLDKMTSLKELILSNNPTGGGLMNLEWHNLRGLAMLDLSNMGLTGDIPESISELKGLRFLGLNDNKLTGVISPKLATLPNLTALYVNGNNLTGELRFSELFYGKLGRRFGAWHNPRLCYPNGLVPSRAPFGVKQCQKEVAKYESDIDSNSKLDKANWNHDTIPMVSFGFSVRGAFGLTKISLIELITVILAFSFSL